ncbi:HNH endonuclease [Streptomyces sp. NPDC050388]|uniref:HNH endonuclease n=1 Tax=Streptomyces sp. NPDC050388 TaxID=3155781 RepID=UPI0034270CF2
MALRMRCLDCRAFAEPGYSRCAEHDRERRAEKRQGRTGPSLVLRKRLNAKGYSHCRECGKDFPAALLRVDHVVPLVDGGKDEWSNLSIVCTNCHNKKSAREARERSGR